MSESSSNQTNAGRPTLCRNCGAIVGAGEPQCAVCGASTANPQTTHSQRSNPADREAIKFARAVLTRPYKFTVILVVANLFVFLLMWESSGLTSEVLWKGFHEPVLEAYGAKLNYLIKGPYYQWWRFVTPMFVHINLPHLLVNMYSLWVVGPYVEKLYGSTKFVVFWVLTGIMGVVASYLTVRPSLADSSLGRFLFKSHDVSSAGASGALFGLVGVLFVFGIKFRHELPEGFKRAFGTGMLPIIMINLFIGYLGRGFIDNAAHLGGLLSGAALALAVQYRRPGERPGVAATWRVLQIAALILVAVSFIKVARNFNAPPLPAPQSVQPVSSQDAIFINYLNVMNQAQEIVSAVIYDRDVSNVDQVAASLTAIAAPDPKALELKERLIAMLTKLSTAASASPSQAAPGPSPSLDQKLLEEHAKWKNEYDEWLKTASQTYSK